MEKLPLVPSTSGYSMADGNEVVRQQMAGGAGRYRRDILGSTARVTVQWFLKPADYRYFRTFYSGVARKGSASFKIDLLLDEPTVTEHVVWFIPDSVRLASVQGLTHVVTAELEVIPIPRDEAYDEIFILLSNEYGDDAAEVMNLLETLANIDLPATSAL